MSFRPAHTPATTSEKPGAWFPVAISMMNSEPHTEAQVTNRLRSSRTISGSPLGASVGRSRIRSSRRARSSNARPPRPRGDGCAAGGGARTPRDGEGPLERRGLYMRSEEHTSELQSRLHLVCRLLLEKKKILARTEEIVPTMAANTTKIT